MAANLPQTPLENVLSNNPSLNGVDRTVPDGLTDITKWFNVPTITNNNTTILTPGTGDNNSKADIIRLTQYDAFSNNVKLGVIWSKRDQTNQDEKNYVDINKRQTMSMWMFFGGYDNDSGTDTGDGMAFVLQNSSDTAFTTLPNKTFWGETLGVWGTETKVTDASSTLASRAIQNSWALEFDTYPNTSGDIGNNFDSVDNVGYVTNHIADNYPGDSASYVKGKLNTPIKLIHNHAIFKVANATHPDNFLTDDRWHHITMTWIPAADTGTGSPEINMKYNDKALDGTLTTPTINQNYPIDLSKFNLGTNDKLYWGFTGSTGNSTENNLVIFESIPAIVEADADSTMFDETSNRYIDSATTDDPYRNTVYDGDKVDINYNLTYKTGSQPWNNIEADIKLPSHIDYDNALITYTDKNNKTSTEDISELSGMTDNEVKHKLAQQLWKDNIVSAKITFSGTINNGSDVSDTSVATEHASFDGDDLQKDVMTKPFVIKHIPNIKLSADKTSLDAVLNQNVDLQGTVSYSDSSTVSSSDFEVHSRVNNADEMSIDSMTSNPFTFTVPADQLKIGKNTVVLYVENKKTHKTSNEITYTINVATSLQLTVAKNSHFRTVQAYPVKRLIKRANDWTIKVIDTRAKGSKWQLSAESTPVNNKWQGGIVYLNTPKSTTQSLTDTPVTIASGTKADSETTDVTSDWTDDDGILMDETGLAKAGTYNSTMSWTVIDSTSN
ncbi:hypothetical protein NV391_11865 [Companilactobacillus crustorum]|uniref:lectin-like domain-containing protein n=1 Tax=Companilactobacillus crustorum TaxID=392416 RepID=UPI00237E43D0|nr:hypothetical protein [Companilactobacillus crustorum]WDT65635.1 hypothetical protein NV391_11865 [Companilactobacillus crustorum]